MDDELEKKVFAWVKADKNSLLNYSDENYCETRDIFQTRLDKMISSFLGTVAECRIRPKFPNFGKFLSKIFSPILLYSLKNFIKNFLEIMKIYARKSLRRQSLLNAEKISEEDVYIIAAIAGEIGNNSFDHNLGSWPDIMGVFFGYELGDGKLKIALADRGQGLLATLKRVKPELKNDSEALFTAFNERVSGRAPEPRGNGLKFVKENIKDRKMHLLFMSGLARAELNDQMTIEEVDDNIRGSLAIISHQYAH